MKIVRNKISKVIRVIFIVLFLGQTLLFASANYQRIVPIDSPLITIINQISLEQGIAHLSSAGPWSVDELILHLKNIKVDKLSPTGQKLYRQAMLEIEQLSALSESRVKASFGFNTTLEGYYHTDSINFTEEEDWYWIGSKRAPLALIEVEASLLENFSIYTNLGLKKNRFAAPARGEEPVESEVFSPPFSTNIVTMSLQDFETPDRAYLSFGGKGYSLQLGRDNLSWGPGHSGNFIISDHHKFQEFLRFTIYSETFKFTSATLFFDPPNWTSKGRTPYSPKYPGDDDYEQNDEYTVRMLLAHRFEFKPLSWLRIELSENVMYQDTAFSFKYLNPLFIFHNLSNRGMFNALADISIQATITKGLSIYASIALDQLEAPGEGDDQESALGYMLGLEGYFPTKTGGLSYRLEGVYTDPLLYRRDKVDFVIMTREREQYYGYIPTYRYLGYQYGGDALVVLANVEWKGISNLAVGGEIQYMAHGEVTIDKEEYNDFGQSSKGPSPSGEVTHFIRSSVFASYPLKIYKNIEMQFGLRADLMSRYTDAWQNDLQLSARIGVSI